MTAGRKPQEAQGGGPPRLRAAFAGPAAGWSLRHMHPAGQGPTPPFKFPGSAGPWKATDREFQSPPLSGRHGDGKAGDVHSACSKLKLAKSSVVDDFARPKI
jgi:hypothetical protein